MSAFTPRPIDSPTDEAPLVFPRSEQSAYNGGTGCVVPMVETEGKSEARGRLCQGVSRGDVARNYPATVHCPTCDGWLCDVHAQSEQWHSSTLLRWVDVGGEA